MTPNDALTLSASAGFGDDQFDDSYFGLQEATFRVVTFGVDFQQPDGGFGAGASYDYERYAGFQQSRTATPGAQAADPLRDWTTDSTERVHYFSVYLRPPRFGRGTETRFSYEYSHARGNYLYGVVPGGPVPPPRSCPRCSTSFRNCAPTFDIGCRIAWPRASRISTSRSVYTILRSTRP